MKLWTLQNRRLLNSWRDGKLSRVWDDSNPAWLSAYRWMADQWSQRIGLALDTAPFWCWHSCNGKLFSPPTVGTAAGLLGDYAHHRESTVVVELDVPQDLCLLSSYFVWNQAVEDLWENNRPNIRTAEYEQMFVSPLLKHDADDIQGVIPYILSNWVIEIRELPKSDDDWDLAV